LPQSYYFIFSEKKDALFVLTKSPTTFLSPVDDNNFIRYIAVLAGQMETGGKFPQFFMYL